MLVIPAIDLKGGKCVRLVQGDPTKQTIYSDDPLTIAKTFEADGAKLIHIVDLDGAFEGKPVHAEIVKKIAKSLSIPIEIGGGIRTQEMIEEYLAAGISRVIVGTVLLSQKFDALWQLYRNHLIVGIDVKNSYVATHGWKEVSSVPAVEFIKTLHEKGAEEFIVTDISTDGMLSGPNIALMEKLLKEVPGIRLIASGGIASIEDLLRLKTLSCLGLKGAIVGKAIYDGRIILADALRIMS
ncbi:MAG: 1-(5-phosphoribosyl)-5-[(5-phosphoribosylamino)methylideneamino]imidazole-4-carboxamide isomerase [Spirochaetes bacterium]|nr:1-(5-phosphoribosyl)-5-[(5-phosphoribosylamino)methylideneamino]imidazole-4-carboxamide isomerase [Spirochaetota bacterium]